MRTIPNISANLQPLEAAIREEFIPAILNGYLCSDLERRLFSLPTKYGGLAIFNPTERCIIEYTNSGKVTAGMVQLVCDQSIIFDAKNVEQQTNITNQLKIEKSKKNQKILEDIKNGIINPISLRTLEAILETGASSWFDCFTNKRKWFLSIKNKLSGISYIYDTTSSSRTFHQNAYAENHSQLTMLSHVQEADLSQYDITKYVILPRKFYQNATMTCMLNR